MSNDSSNASSGVGFFSLLGILFIGLKLTGYIDWSWYWVLAPLWLPVSVLLACLLIFFLVLAIAKLVRRALS